MRRWIRRSILALLLLIAAAVVLSGVGVAMFKCTPSWYAAPASTSSQREQFARAAENKLIDAQNWAGQLRADNVRADRLRSQGAATLPATRAAGTLTIEFEEQELNALFQKWSALYGWSQKYGEFVEDPRIVLRQDRLILAGRVRDLGSIVSLQFHPQVDEQGRLHFDIVRVTGGKLPLPDAVWIKWQNDIVDSLRSHLPQWRATARIDPAGAANTSAMAATFSQMLFAIAERRPAEPVLFLPLVERGQAVPVKVGEVKVEQGKLMMQVQPLTSGERTALLTRIRSPQRDAQASGE